MKTDLEKILLRDYSNDYRLNNLYRMIPKTGRTVLDVGTGNGLIYHHLKDHFEHIYLSDVSTLILKNLQEKFAGKKGMEILKIDTMNFKLLKRVALITSCDVIEHVEDDQSALEMYHKNLKKGGKIFIAVPAIKHLYGVRDRKMGHYRRYSKKMLQFKLEKAGFKNITIKYWNFIGVLPYLISEKIFNKELAGVARTDLKNAFARFINRILFIELMIESKIRFFPLGLTLVAKAEK